MAPEAAAPPAGEKMAIRVLSRRLVKASDASIQPHVAAVSNLDLYPNSYQASIVCLYPNNGGEFAAVVATFEAVLPSLLNHFYPLAGRIVVDPSTGLPELHCHNQGAELVVGEVDVALGSLDYAVTNESVKRIMVPYPKDVPLSVQLLRFACGSFSVVWGKHNLLHDGQVSTMIVRMWSELARTGRISDGLPINHDRSVFRPRNPPSYGDALDAMFTTYDDGRLVNALTAHDSFIERLYYIEAGDIARLRDAASADSEQKLQRASRVQAVSAYLWKALAGTVFASFPLDTDFGFGQATLAMPIWDHGKVACGTLAVGVRPRGDGSWLVSAYIWPWMAAALESDGVLKPLTAAYLGLV
uniref:Uncharacterized protein n=1 Tax=Oryza punctata TaxID=4537 RepID=A0A0E0LIW8_ORYPU